MIVNRRREMGGIADDGYIHFKDPEVVRILTAAGIIPEGGGITIEEAVTSTFDRTLFKNNQLIEHFDEFKYFTKMNAQNTDIGDLFNGCANLISTDLTSLTNLFSAICRDCNSLMYFNGEDGPQYTLSLPNLIRTKNSGAGNVFSYCTLLKHVTSLGIVPRLENSTFRSCTNLEDVTLPNQCVNLQGSCFQDCSKLSVINLSQLTTISGNVFQNCSSLEYCDGPNSTQGELNLPNLTGTLGDSAFKGCVKLTSIASLGSITTIGNSAFENCSLLANINIPSTVEKVNKAAFAGTAWLNSQPNNSAIIINNKCLYSFKGSLGANYVVPSTVKYITENALYNVSGLEEISIPSSVTEVGRSCLGGNTSLTTINYGSSADVPREFAQSSRNLTALNITGNPTSIGAAAFKYCNLLSINIPASVISIASDAFFGNGSCASISVNANNTIFDSRDNCNAIINTATNALIKGCKNTEIPNTVTALNSFAFAGVTEMVSIDIPANVSSLGSEVFKECSQLQSVTVRAITPPSVGSNIFVSCHSNLVINVPSGSVSAYQSASGWSKYASKIQAIQT